MVSRFRQPFTIAFLMMLLGTAAALAQGVTSSGLTVFGDSVSLGIGPTYLSQSWANLVANSFGPPFKNYSASGDEAADMAKKVFSNTERNYTPLPSTAVFIGINDQLCGVSLGCQNNYRMALQASVAALAIPKINKVFGQQCSISSGITVADNSIPGVAALQSTTNGTVIACTIGGGTEVDVAWHAWDGNGGVATLKIDGVTMDTLNAYGNSGVNIATQNRATDTIFDKQYTVATANSHTVTFTVTSASSASNKFSMVFVAAPVKKWTTSALSRVFVMGIPLGPNAAIYDTIASSVAAIYARNGLPVQFVPTRPFFNSATDQNQTPTNVSGILLTDAVTNRGSANVTSATASFRPDSVGQLLEINGAGRSGGWLDAYITAYSSSTTVTINTPTLTSGTGLTAYYGPIGAVCGANVSTPWYLHPNNCGEAHIRDALLEIAQPTTRDNLLGTHSRAK